MQLTLTYGEMPSREQFDEAWDIAIEENPEARSSTFGFGNDKRLGNCQLTNNELWDEILKAHDEYNTLLNGDTEQDPEVVGDWLSTVLSCLGIEWV